MIQLQYVESLPSLVLTRAGSKGRLLMPSQLLYGAPPEFSLIIYFIDLRL